MNILFIVPYVPDLVRVRPYHFIRQLTNRGHRVSVATLWTTPNEEIKLAEIKRTTHEVYSCYQSKLRSLIQSGLALFSKDPIQANYCWNKSFAQRLSFLLGNQDHPFDVVHIEHLRGANYGLFLKSEMGKSIKTQPSPPIVWDSVDSISLLFEQTAKKSQKFSSRLIASIEKDRTYRFEKMLIDQFDEVLVTSPLDQNSFESMRVARPGNTPITVIPNGVDLAYFSPSEDGKREPATLVVSGKMSYHANITMAHYLVDKIMPVVWSQKPEVKIVIVGKDPPPSIKKLADNPLITVTGTVDDIRPYLRKATMAVAPITYGVGIQNKVLEAMACGTPVISTPQAVSALTAQSGEDLRVAGDPNQFVHEIIAMLESPEMQDKIGRAGREYVHKNHDWMDIGLRIENRYQEAIIRSVRNVQV